MKEQVHLPFWSFFHAIEKTLSYERWIDKYELFLQVIMSNDLSYVKDHTAFINFCKALYLQDHRDEQKFVELLNYAIQKEKNWLRGEIKKSQPSPALDQPSTPANNEPVKNIADKSNEPFSSPGKSDPFDFEMEEEELVKEEEKPNYVTASYQLKFEEPVKKTIHNNEQVNYLQTDEYFPVTRRQMIKGWQFLRRKETGGDSGIFDIKGTIKQIAKEGTFLYPKYHPGTKNRKDTIIIFSDYRGSMIAFHELSDRLVTSARSGGGHPNAPVFYFQNFPVGYVYRHSNLTEPVDFSAALRHANRNFTLAFIISDAGAARGKDPAGAKIRFEKTQYMLEKLNKACAHTIWLNPMPVHRWKDTAAELIRKEVFIMAPIMESNTHNFQDMMRTILKQKAITL
jgi:uncharacterized protein with von Willebrand factor type A (vWA) domain